MAQASDTGQEGASLAVGLVERLRSGDESAWSQICRHYGPGLRYLLKRRTNGDENLAEDICQEALIAVREKILDGSLRDPGKLPAFLRSLAINKLIGERRKETRHATTADSDAVAETATNIPGPFDNVAREQHAKLVRQMLDELGVENYRELLVRVYLQDEDKQQVCAALGISGKKFDNDLYRAKARFRQLLTQSNRVNTLKLIE